MKKWYSVTFYSITTITLVMLVGSPITLDTNNLTLPVLPETFDVPTDLDENLIRTKIEEAIAKIPDHTTECRRNSACSKWLTQQKAILDTRSSDMSLSLFERSFVYIDEMSTINFRIFFLKDQIAVQTAYNSPNSVRNTYMINFENLANKHFDKLLAAQRYGNASQSVVNSFGSSSGTGNYDHNLMHIGFSDTLFKSKEDIIYYQNSLNMNTGLHYGTTPNIFLNRGYYLKRPNTFPQIFRRNRYAKNFFFLFENIRSIVTKKYDNDNYFCSNLPVLSPSEKAIAQGFSAGDGSFENPFRICTLTQLASLNKKPEFQSSHFRLMKDIDASTLKKSLITANEGVFAGSFDGNGYTIKLGNVTRNPDKNLDYSGLFGDLSGAQIVNLKLDIGDFFVTKPIVSGVIGANCNFTTIENIEINYESSNVPLICGSASNISLSKVSVDSSSTNYSGITSAAGLLFGNISSDGGSSYLREVTLNAHSANGLVGNAFFSRDPETKLEISDVYSRSNISLIGFLYGKASASNIVYDIESSVIKLVNKFVGNGSSIRNDRLFLISNRRPDTIPPTPPNMNEPVIISRFDHNGMLSLPNILDQNLWETFLWFYNPQSQPIKLRLKSEKNNYLRRSLVSSR